MALAIVLLVASAAAAETETPGLAILDQAREMDLRANTKEDKEGAIAKYREALEIFQKNQYHKGIFISANNLGTIYARLGQFDKADEYFDVARSALELITPPSPKDKLTFLHNTALIYKSRGQYSRALKNLQTSRQIAREIKDEKSERQVLYSLGAIYFEMSVYGNAFEHYKRSLGLAEKLNDTEGIVRAYYGMAQVSVVWGRYREAEEQYQKVLSSCSKLEGETKDCEGAALNGIGLLHEGYGRYDEALKYFRKALQAAVETGREQATSRFNIARVQHFREEYDEALAGYFESLQIFEKSGDVAGTALVKKLISYLYVDKCESNPAQCDVKTAEEFARASDQWVALGRLHLFKKDYPAAGEYYKKALDYGEKHGDSDGLFMCCTGLGMAHEALGHLELAESYYTRAIEHVEEIRAGLMPGERVNFFHVEIGGFMRVAPYKGLARVQCKMGKFREAFRTSEYTKARAFSESVCARSTQNMSLPREVAERDQELNERLAALLKRRQLSYQAGDKEAVDTLASAIKSVKSQLDDHVTMLRESYPVHAATEYPEPMGLEKTLFGSDEWVMALDVTDQGVISYLTRGKEIVNAKFIPVSRKSLDELVRKFREPLEMVAGRDDVVEKLKSFDLDTGRKLAGLLMGHALQYLPSGKPLLIVPDDSLGVLPFEMLVLDEEGRICSDGELPSVCDARFLGDRNPIYYCQSATALSLARMFKPPQALTESILVIADPVFQPNDARMATARNGHDSAVGGVMTQQDRGRPGPALERLELTGELAQSLETIFRGHAEVYTGLDANKDYFINKIAPDLQRFDKIVFATHGYFGSDLPGVHEPTLILSTMPPGRDGYLLMSEIMSLKMGADVVALTACQTGLGKRISGEGTMGMARAFQYAGAKTVLMSFWAVAEAPSTDLVKSFFLNLSRGYNKLDALTSARKEIRKQGFDHPFFWAAFGLVGEPDAGGH